MDGRQSRLLLCELGIEVANISWSFDLREVWWGYSFVDYIVPAHVLEEWMALNFLRVIWSST
jgi:hypothetical protein